jgi:polyisoprenoid-binding protein YceI
MQTQSNPSNARAQSPSMLQSSAAHERYQIDSAHASAQFKVRHLMVSHVRGELGTVSGELQLDPSDVSRSEVRVSIDARAIDTRHPERDAHLRSADFLDVENYPAVIFESTRVSSSAGGELEVTGNLSIRGVTRPVALAVDLSEAVTDPWGNVKRGVTATARINRKDFGVSWNANMDAGGVVVGDQVDITIELELVRKVGY